MVDHLERIDHVAHVFAHLIAFGIEHESRRNHVLECHAVEDHRSDGMQREEPAACLIHALVDEICGECRALVDRIAMLERIMHLGVGHRTGVEPHVDEVGLAVHRFAALAHQYDVVYIGAMQVDLVIILFVEVIGHESFFFHRVG